MYILGCDIGSTTIKTVVLNNKSKIMLSMYNIHKGDVIGTFNKHLEEVFKKFPASIEFAGVSGSLSPPISIILLQFALINFTPLIRAFILFNL